MVGQCTQIFPKIQKSYKDRRMAIPNQALEEKIKPISKKEKNPTDAIEARRTPELVVAICGAVGSGVSTVTREIEKKFKQLSYSVDIIKISDLIKETLETNLFESKYERIKALQIAGNKLREEFGNDHLAQLAIKTIVERRIKFTSEKIGKNESEIDYGHDARIERRHVTIIDSLKNDKEVELLQKVYSDMFCMFGVLCNDALRKERLSNEGEMSDSEAADIMDRDKKEKIEHGQQLLKTLQKADFFIRNNQRNISNLEAPVNRFVSLLLGQNNITPTIDEFGMYIAESAARRSGCLSRQVGAAILTESGDIVSIGRNDVPKPFGGLYGEEDGDDDDRCLKQHDHACVNEKRKERIYQKLENSMKDVINDASLNEKVDLIITQLREESEIKDLLEYSRAVHAEMDAITTAARNGNYSLKNTILYSTTFPCHHCARHIVASGIKRVYYIEPYEKSLAVKLHPDAISLDSQGGSSQGKKVLFSHFEGVAPKRYLDLFSCNNRKKSGRLNLIDLNQQKPSTALFLDTFIEYESKVASYLKALSESIERGKDESQG